VSAPPTRADLIASSRGHHRGSRGRRPISRTQRRANERGYIFSSCPAVWVAGGCSDSSSRSHTGAIRSDSSLKRCRPPDFQIDVGLCYSARCIGWIGRAAHCELPREKAPFSPLGDGGGLPRGDAGSPFNSPGCAGARHY